MKKFIISLILLLEVINVWAPPVSHTLENLPKVIITYKIDSDYELLTKAVFQIESSKDSMAFNEKENAVGGLQIRQCRVDHYNSIKGTNYKLNDFFNFTLSKEMFLFFAKGKSIELAAKRWNGSGPSTEIYWNKVHSVFLKLKKKNKPKVNYEFMDVHPKTHEAYRLLHEGVLAFARAERQGICIDVEYVEETKRRITKKIDRYEREFKESNFFKDWRKSTKSEININSGKQLSQFLYQVKGVKPPKTTKTGEGSTDVEALEQLKIPELDKLLYARKLKKIRDTYLDSFYREHVDGVIHPFFNLHTVKTFRSCVAKGSLILVARDFIDNPKGIPIEDVKVGDYVYSFDDDLNLRLKKVLWSGKTGDREVIRIYFQSHGGGGDGHLDVTPEHLIRLIDGRYAQAKDLMNDYRGENESKHTPKCRALSCVRRGDKLNATGHLKHGKGIIEHRFIYSELIGSLLDNEVIHHKNGNHFDHSLSNLEKMTLKEHSYLHGMSVTEEQHMTRVRHLAENRHKITYKYGYDNPNALRLTKFQCYRILSENSGQSTKAGYNFDSFKACCIHHDINIKAVKLRYDKNGAYIWKTELKKLSLLGRAEVSKKLGHNYYKLLDLYRIYGVNQKRNWANQFGKFDPANHSIVSIRYINKIVPVYDLEVEDTHNFIANEICVHNSANSPNFQNIPKRDKEAMNICRGALIPRKGFQFFEPDFSGVEVRVAACYHKDPTMIKYITDNYDMHGDMAKQIFCITEYDKRIPSHGTLRQAAKNGFVFPQFYGDYYKNCAANLAEWGNLPQSKWRAGQGIDMLDWEPKLHNFHLADHMLRKGIKSYEQFVDHLQKIEEDFWGKRFKVYAKWKDAHYNQYLKNGYVDLYTGFRCTAQMSKNDAINYPVQGAAFHCLLWSFIEVDRISREEKWQSRLVGQIHDSMLVDTHPSELTHVANTIKRVTCVDILKRFPWINVPIEIEADYCEVDEPWSYKKEYKFVS